MYEEFWHLKSRPFRNTPDPGYYYHSRQHDEALMKLTYVVRENMGAGMLTGAYGCGKTLLGQVLTQQIGSAHVVAACNAQPEMAALDFLRAIARSVGRADIPATRSELVADALMEKIEQTLTENARDGKHTVILIDEAHLLASPSALETTRLLLNFQRPDTFRMTLLLLGHPELADRVAGVKQLAQRIPITCTLGQFTREDTAAYIRLRLAVAGREQGPFTDDAITLIHCNSGGIPRRINTLCDVGLALGYAQKAERLEASLVLEAAEKFGVG